MAPDREEPTTGEIVRRLDSIAAQLTEVIREIKEDRAHNAQTYIRQDVYLAQRKADQAIAAGLQAELSSVKSNLGHRIDAVKKDLEDDVDEVKDARTADVNFRRQVIFGFALAAAGWIVTIALFIATYLTRSA